MLRRDSLIKPPFRAHCSCKRLRAGGIKRKLLFAVALLAIIIALFPTIIAKTPLRNSLLSAVIPGNAVHISIGSASLSWISAPAASVVQITDAAGNPLLTAET